MDYKNNKMMILMCLLVVMISGCTMVRVKPKMPNRLPAQIRETDKTKINGNNNVRIALVLNSKRIAVSSDSPVRIYNMKNKHKVADVRLNQDAQMVVRNGGLMVNGRTIEVQKCRLVVDKGKTIRIGDKHYRGQIEVIVDRNSSEMTIINYLPLEEYLCGVVPNEVSSKWPREALKAQAVAARTFSYYKMSGRINQSYDLDATVNSQVYRGYDSEKESTNIAVYETAGEIMCYQGKVVAAFYHSNCGGHTANVRDVWSSEMAYLGGTSCGFCDDGPHSNWEWTIPFKELAARLRNHGAHVGNITGIDLMGRDGSGRVMSLAIRHDLGREEIKASAFRMMVGADQLRSTKFNIRNDGDRVKFWGKGWGHGVGLCQEGAMGMADSGFSYSDILRHYYPGIDIVTHCK